MNQYENFKVLFKHSRLSFPNFEAHIIEGVVVDIKKNVVYVDVGLKTNVKFFIDELTYSNSKLFPSNSTINVGNYIQFFFENNNGEIILNHDYAKKLLKQTIVWNLVEQQHIVYGRILNSIKGGFSVGIAGLVAFLPKNKAGKKKSWNRSVHNLKYLTHRFQILKINHARRNIIVKKIN